jgi:predicted phosphodiesterase
LPDLTGIIKIFLVGILGALLLVSLLSSQDVTIQALDFTIALQIFDKGYTVIDLPPLGTIRAQTHQMPLMFRISLKNINLDRLSDLVAAQDPERVFAEIQETLRRQVTVFLGRIVALSFLGGVGAGYLYFRNASKSLYAGLAGLLAFSILVGSAVFTYDETAFREPAFEGIVEAAPWLMGVAEEALAAVEGLDAKMQIVTSNLMVLFESLKFLGGQGIIEGELKILHVSDIHNNPIGVSLASQMAESFGVNLIIDTGDATDYGTPLESDFIARIDAIGLPWVFVPGNHDSPAVVEAFRELENAIVLMEDVVYLEDLDIAIAGVSDPAAETVAMAVRPRAEYKAAADRLKDRIRESSYEPAIIIAHHIYVVEEFIDTYSVLLHGHSHRVNIRTLSNSVVIDAGTTGGAGIRGLMTRDEMPFSMILLHFNRVDGGRWVVTAADVIKVHQLNAGFIIERQLLNQPLPGPLQPLGEDREAEEE